MKSEHCALRPEADRFDRLTANGIVSTLTSLVTSPLRHKPSVTSVTAGFITSSLHHLTLEQRRIPPLHLFDWHFLDLMT